jgi:hypothetical protein
MVSEQDVAKLWSLDALCRAAIFVPRWIQKLTLWAAAVE